MHGRDHADRGVDSIAPNQLRNYPQQRSLTTLRLAAVGVEQDTDSAQILQQWDLRLSDDAESVQLSIAFNSDSPVTSGQYVPMSEVSAGMYTVQGFTYVG